jgi:endonuclease YncB( thermonuclease family)
MKSFNLLCKPFCLLSLMAAALTCSTHAWSEEKPARAPRSYSGMVSRVVDGDTVWLATADRRAPLKVRMLGIDAPEICQAGGTEAREALRERLQGRQVRVAVSGSRSRDDYGRLLGRVFVEDEDVGRWMVSSGQAWSYHYRNSKGPYAPEEARAMGSRRGIFARGDAENPRDFRRRHGDCPH